MNVCLMPPSGNHFSRPRTSVFRAATQPRPRREPLFPFSLPNSIIIFADAKMPSSHHKAWLVTSGNCRALRQVSYQSFISHDIILATAEAELPVPVCQIPDRKMVFWSLIMFQHFKPIIPLLMGRLGATIDLDNQPGISSGRFYRWE